MAVDAMRFIFMCILCPFHCPAVNPFPNGYIAVEFFFILAGFFIYRSYRKHYSIDTFDFTFIKIKRFFFPLVLSIFALMLLDRKRYIYPHDFTPDGILSQYYIHIPEFFFCQGLEMVKSGIVVNVSLWFISILILGGAFIYSLLKNYENKAISLFLPICIILGITYLLSFGNCGLLMRHQLHGSPFNCNLVRGVVEMGIGTILAYFCEKRENTFLNHITLVNILSIICLVGICLVTVAHDNYDILVIFMIPIVILACSLHKSWLYFAFRGKVWIWLGNISMYMYFIHIFVSASYYIIDTKYHTLSAMPSFFSFVIYIGACVFAGFMLKLMSDKLYKFAFK